ncbi:helix-turn-helix transcriptional regulator [Paenibacillus sp. LHD-38]|uniref:PadR family transcriptional regulator n=1 Tax=Paenibacillus sp. LHD-38 TaxID=3072143 RepID=UPI0028107046|nr:helix-turn-helix transcriptional regulator [Paenibacillus sp. LHD-38]MDQ8738378.1 helix-turn-helix transcriptional regulator [Paenibacillus sp. LHD-38]
MKINKELLKGSTVGLVLKMLDQKDMYGYEIIKEMQHKSGGVFEFKEGTLYPILHSLETDELVIAYWEVKESRNRKYYRITPKGQKQLSEKKREWNLFRNAVDGVLGEGSV